MYFIWELLYLAKTTNWGLYFLRLLLKFYLIIWATQRSSCLQGTGGTFISHYFFKDPEYWSGPRNRTHDLPPCSQDCAVPAAWHLLIHVFLLIKVVLILWTTLVWVDMMTLFLTCTLEGIFWKTSYIWSLKPLDNISSASSKTNILIVSVS